MGVSPPHTPADRRIRPARLPPKVDAPPTAAHNGALRLPPPDRSRPEAPRQAIHPPGPGGGRSGPSQNPQAGAPFPLPRPRRGAPRPPRGRPRVERSCPRGGSRGPSGARAARGGGGQAGPFGERGKTGTVTCRLPALLGTGRLHGPGTCLGALRLVRHLQLHGCGDRPVGWRAGGPRLQARLRPPPPNNNRRRPEGGAVGGFGAFAHRTHRQSETGGGACVRPSRERLERRHASEGGRAASVPVLGTISVLTLCVITTNNTTISKLRTIVLQ